MNSRELTTGFVLLFISLGYVNAVHSRYWNSVRKFREALKTNARLNNVYNDWINCTSNWWITLGQPCDFDAEYFEGEVLRRKYSREGIDYIFFASPSELKKILRSLCGWIVAEAGNNCIEADSVGSCVLLNKNSDKTALARVKQNLTKNCDKEINALHGMYNNVTVALGGTTYVLLVMCLAAILVNSNEL